MVTWYLAIGHNFQGLRFALHVQLSSLMQVEHQDHADGYDSLALRMNDNTVKVTSRILQENQDGCVFFAISGRVQLLQSGYESINLRFPLHSLAWTSRQAQLQGECKSIRLTTKVGNLKSLLKFVGLYGVKQ